MSLRIQCVDFDAHDPQSIANFWQEALGWRPVGSPDPSL